MKEDDLKEVVDYLNKRFNQDSDEYNFFIGSKPQVIRYNDEIAISTWGCGAIVCIEDSLYFIEEDDGYWFSNDYISVDRIDSDYRGMFTKNGLQTSFSISWADSFISALQRLNDYVKENGEPYYYIMGTDENGNEILSEKICGYKLKKIRT